MVRFSPWYPMTLAAPLSTLTAAGNVAVVKLPLECRGGCGAGATSMVTLLPSRGAARGACEAIVGALVDLLRAAARRAAIEGSTSSSSLLLLLLLLLSPLSARRLRTATLVGTCDGASRTLAGCEREPVARNLDAAGESEPESESESELESDEESEDESLPERTCAAT